MLSFLLLCLAPGLVATLAVWWFAKQRALPRLKRALLVAGVFGVLCAPGAVGGGHAGALTCALVMIASDPSSVHGYWLVGATAVLAFTLYLGLAAVADQVRPILVRILGDAGREWPFFRARMKRRCPFCGRELPPESVLCPDCS
jgi:hypothetical protein